MSQINTLSKYIVKGKVLTVSCEVDVNISYSTTMTRNSPTMISGYQTEVNKKAPLSLTTPYKISAEAPNFRVFHIMLRENLL